jgi:hypothetical protein
MLVKLFAFSLFVFLLIPSLQPPQAQAWCCGCGCMYGCTCPGYWDRDQRRYCSWTCRSTEPVLQTKAPIDGSTDNVRSVDESLRSSNLRSDFLMRVAEVRVLTPCLRNKIALSILGDTMKLDLARFDDKKNAQEQTLALH